MSDHWNLERRRQLLTAYSTALDRMEDLLWTESRGDRIDLAEMQSLQERLSSLWDAYAASVPRLPMARCPFSGVVAHHSCDNLGLDGLWWNYESPVRPEEDLPPTFLALTGAVTVDRPPAWTSFLCQPGPAVPYVLPHLLDRPPVRGVLRGFPVGRHLAYALSYFVELPGLSLARPNTWGTGYASWKDAAGKRHWREASEEQEQWDFDLRPWLDSGRLLWIAPGDATLRLRSGSSRCPYVDLRGERRPQYVQFGEVTVW